MERTKYDRSGNGAGRARGGWSSGSGGGRGGFGGGRSGSGAGRSGSGEGGGNNYQKYHQGQYQTGGGGRNSGGGGNNYQQHNQGQYQSGGYGRRGRDGGRSGAQMGTNPPPSQPWGDRPVQGGTQMGTYPPPAQPWGYRPVQGGQGGTQRPESAMGQRVGATGGRGAWSGGPPYVAGRGSWASAVRGGDGAGQAQIRILYLFLFLFLKLIYSCASPLLDALSLSPCPTSLLCCPCCLLRTNGDAVTSSSFIINFFHIIIAFICGFIGP